MQNKDMTEILTGDTHPTTNPIMKGFNAFKKLDKFYRMAIISMLLIMLATPIIVSNNFDIRQKAATTSGTLVEAENGNIDGAKIVADASVMGGKYVEFTTGQVQPTPSPTRIPTATGTTAPTRIPTATQSPNIPTPTSVVQLPGGSGNYTCDVTIGPGESIAGGLIRASKVLCLKGGTYNESPSLSKSGVTVAAVKGERPVISGRVGIGANMIIDGINVTWNNSMGSSQHLVVMSGANNTVLKNGEIWGAHSYAGLLVTGGTTNFLIQNMYIHDTYKSNDTNQDHLIYINNASYGIVERSLFVNSPNGRGIKLGPPSGGDAGPHHITIRYNTFYDNLGPSNIQLSYGSHDNEVYRNAMQKSSQTNITGYNLNGSNNRVHDNIGWESDGVFGGGGLTDGGGNIMMNPQYTSDYHNGNPQAQSYGKYAQ